MENSPSTNVLEASDLTKSYALNSREGSLSILTNLSLTIARGERIAIVGPSGSGKSTLLSILAGIDRPDSGTVQIEGSDLSGLSDSLRAETIGVVFQNFELVPSFSALENVMLPLDINARSDREKAKKALVAVGLADRTDHIPSRLSGGEQQRVAVARALIAEPSLLLCDEPTGNLDAKTGDTIMRLILDQVQEHGSSLLVITHDMSIAASMDRVLTLRDGALVETPQTNHHD